MRALAAHMLGMTAMAASLREQLRQMRTAKRRGGEFIDALTAVQVEKYEGWTPERIVAEFQRLAPRPEGPHADAGARARPADTAEQPVNPPYE